MPQVQNFGEENTNLKPKNWRYGGKSSKLIVNYQINVINPSFVLVVYALAMDS